MLCGLAVSSRMRGAAKEKKRRKGASWNDNPDRGTDT
jgi:hypothetical protein